MTKQNLYIIVWTFGIIGFLWLAYHLKADSELGSLCITKKISGYPCPACGSTRSATLIIEGHFKEAFLINPLGYLALLLLVISPIWVMIDILSNQSSYFTLYKKIETKFSNKYILSIFVFLILLNWIWNIKKGL